MHSRQELAADFRRLGVAPGDVVMLHASVRAVGEVAGGPDQIHLALKDALTTDGTLMMYASCPRYYDEVGRGNLTAKEEKEVLEKLPPFDPATARSARDNGTLVEFLRTWPGASVNNHVARFVVWGRCADYLLSHQPWNYALGVGSPLERFLELNGKILLLGCDHDTVTFLHYAEHIVDIPNKRITRYKVPVEENGARVWRDMEEVDTNVAHANWPDRFFAKITDGYLTTAGNEGTPVGNAMSYLLPARELLDFALPLMRSAAGVPYIVRPHHAGDMGWVVQRHGVLYADEYGWNEEFEAMIAEIVAKFIQNLDAKREQCWIAERDGKNVGCVFLVKKSSTVAQLRLLIVEPSARGLGIGKRLVEECIQFARRAGYRKLMLWTDDVLHAARHIYERNGFRLVKENKHHSFGHDLVGQTWELKLK